MCVSEEALEHLLLEMREEQAVFGPPTANGPPCISDGSLYVEREKVAEMSTMSNLLDELLTWGAAFSVFAQPVKKSVEGTAHLILVHVLKTDVTKPPKSFKKVSKFL